MSGQRGNAAKNESFYIARGEDNKKYFRLRKKKAEAKREKQTLAEQSREIFERKKNSAPEKKAPYTSRTRGYYRFSKDYPSNVDANLFRENLRYGKKTLTRHAVIAAVCCVLAFCAGFIPARTAMFISAFPVENETTAPTEENGNTFELEGILISYDELRSGDSAAIISKLNANGCGTAVFEFKNDSGYCIFNTGAFIGASADRRIANAYDTVNAVKAAGFSTAAYISCFLDSCAPVSDYTYAVRSGSAEGGAWRDNSSRCWLNPFSQQARDYVLSVVKAAADGGFSRIILGNVCFPTDSGESEAFFDGESESEIGRNELLREFIASAVSAAGTASVTVMCDLAAVNADDDNNTGGASGSLLGTAAGSVCVDARASRASVKTVIGEKTVTGASSMPYVLVSETASYTRENMLKTENAGDAKIFLLIDGSDEEKIAVDLGNADGFIIW